MITEYEGTDNVLYTDTTLRRQQWQWEDTDMTKQYQDHNTRNTGQYWAAAVNLVDNQSKDVSVKCAMGDTPHLWKCSTAWSNNDSSIATDRKCFSTHTHTRTQM